MHCTLPDLQNLLRAEEAIQKEQLKKEQIGKGSIQFNSLNVGVVVSGEVAQS